MLPAGNKDNANGTVLGNGAHNSYEIAMERKVEQSNNHAGVTNDEKPKSQPDAITTESPALEQYECVLATNSRPAAENIAASATNWFSACFRYFFAVFLYHCLLLACLLVLFVLLENCLLHKVFC